MRRIIFGSCLALALLACAAPARAGGFGRGFGGFGAGSCVGGSCGGGFSASRFGGVGYGGVGLAPAVGGFSHTTTTTTRSFSGAGGCYGGTFGAAAGGCYGGGFGAVGVAPLVPANVTIINNRRPGLFGRIGGAFRGFSRGF